MKSASSSALPVFLLPLLCLLLLLGNQIEIVSAQNHADLCKFANIPDGQLGKGAPKCADSLCNDACQIKFGSFNLGWCDRLIDCLCFKPCNMRSD
ncbi:unnamed protein product [Linum tenue]|uniref:Uncharacterized protein n=1 Tax=Linum tenue TaxID=586396 RepID=A0AAV0HCK8_9ROSI|nr:unnamed protein product [Linum tenue]